MDTIRRRFPRRYASWHPHVCATPGTVPGVRRGAALTIVSGPAGRVTQPGTDHPYQGMDPSDPVTWVRPYSPRPGMVARLNFDGASPSNPTGGVQRGRQPFLFWTGGVAGSSVNNG